MQLLSLDQLLEAALTAIYQAWYTLPRRAALPQLERLRAELADTLATLPRPVDVAACERALIGFAQAASALPAVRAAGGDLLAQLAAAAPLGPDNRRPGYVQFRRTDVAPERIRVLVALLRAEEPPRHVIRHMTYALGSTPRLWQAVLDAVEPRLGDMPADDRERVLAIERACADAVAAAPTPREKLAAFQAGLEQLEQVPAVIRLAGDVFFAGKYVGKAPTTFDFDKSLLDKDLLDKDLLDKDLLVPRPPWHVITSAEPPWPPMEPPSPVPPPPPPTAPPETGPPGPGEPSTTVPTGGEPPATPPAGVELPANLPVDINPSIEVTPAEQRVELYSDVRFPARVKRGTVQWLTVQLTVEQAAESRVARAVPVAFAPAAPDEPPPPEYVEVRLVAPGCNEVTGIWERTILVYADRDSQPAVFLLSSDSLGTKRITVDFNHKGRMIGTLAFKSEVVADVTGPGQPVTPETQPEVLAPAGDAPPAADLELRVTRTAQSNVLSFMLTSTKPGVPFRSQPVGQVTLGAADPQSFLGQYLDRLSTLAGADVGSKAEQERNAADTAALGEELFEHLLPPELQRLYWSQLKPLREQGVITTLLVNSDEPWIPWELIKPFRYDDAAGQEEKDSFLVEAFVFSRWLARPLPPNLTVQEAALVMPDLNLPAVQVEKKFFDKLAKQRKLKLQGPLQARDAVLDSLYAGEFQLLHFATHGNFNPANAELSELELSDGTLAPGDLLGSRLSGMRRSRPLVFLNACHSGQVALSLTGLGGWAEKLFRDGRASVFVGALWDVTDELATAFAGAFYSELRDGKTLGEAMRAARLVVRQQQEGNPTWLAYALYGDPNSTVTLGSPSS